MRIDGIWNRGNYLLALPLQHGNLQFFDIFEIGVTERVEKEVDFKHVSMYHILVEDWCSGLQQCIAFGEAKT